MKNHAASADATFAEAAPRQTAPQLDLLAAGTRLDERYEIIEVLGRGGMAIVYLAQDQKLGRQVVIKVLSEESRTDAAREWIEKKFKQEHRILATIDHPGVVGLLDLGELADGRAYLVMQYVPGQTLRQALASGRLDLARAGRLVRQIGDALAAVHEHQVIHRDLKPENIMLQSVGGVEYAKIIDFGIAKLRQELPGQKTAPWGTDGYLAPEQRAGHPTPASDIYALGVIAYEMVTGRHPSETKTQSEERQCDQTFVRPGLHCPELPAAAEAAILKALSSDTGGRYANARQFADDLAGALTGELKDVSPKAARPELELAHVLFMDLVGYSLLTIDDQKSRLQKLQKIVSATASFRQAQAARRLISLPAGDGLALVFFEDPQAPVECAVEIARALKAHAEIKLRMGIHTGPVSRFPDINQNLNIAGGGINQAQRVMEFGDAGHILLSNTATEILRQLDEMGNHLMDLGEVRVKHGVKVRLFNLYSRDIGNRAYPARLSSGSSRKLWLTVSLLALVSAGLGTWWYVHAPRPTTASEPAAGSTITAGSSLSYSLTVQKDPKRYPGSKPFQLPGEIIFEAGYLVRLQLNSPRRGHLYVINEGPEQARGLPEFVVLFPNTPANGDSAEIAAGQSIQIPYPSQNPAQDWFYFDREEGVEKIWLVWSEQSVPELDAVKSLANPKDNGVVSDPGQIQALAQYLASHRSTLAEAKEDEITKQTVLRAKEAVLVGMIKLEHH